MSAFGLSFVELPHLQAAFHDENGKPQTLNKEAFVRALKENQKGGEGSETDLELLFKKIDAGSVGVIDWEGLTNFLLFHLPNSDGASTGMSFPIHQNRDLVMNPCQRHHDMINDVVVIPSSLTDKMHLRRYVTVGRDGCIKTWNQNLQLLRSIEVATKSWLSSAVWMKNTHRLAVASSDSSILFYDLEKQHCVSKIPYQSGTPLVLGYHECSGKEIIMVGDNNGGVTCYHLSPEWYSRDVSLGGHNPNEEKQENSRVRTSKKQPSRFVSQGIEIGKNHNPYGKEGENLHSDWVTQVGFVSDQGLVSSSLDSTMNICDIQKHERKREPIKMHRKGVTSWAWSSKYKFFASGGLDRQIIIWNPYNPKVVSYLQGHNAPIQQVVVNEKDHQLISLSSDKVIKIWDLRSSYRCIQTFVDKTGYTPEDRLTRMALDEETPSLILCSATVNILPLHSSREDVQRSRTHEHPIVDALYNSEFWQIVTGDQSGTVALWNISTGALDFQFHKTHGNAKLTCMMLDTSLRRLFTGGDDGEVRLWNVSSGQLLRTFHGSGEMVKLSETRDGQYVFLIALTEQGGIFMWLQQSTTQVVSPQSTFSAKTLSGDADMPLSQYSEKGIIYIGTEGGKILSFRVTETTISPWKRGGGEFESVDFILAFSPDVFLSLTEGRALITAWSTKTKMQLWSCNTEFSEPSISPANEEEWDSSAPLTCIGRAVNEGPWLCLGHQSGGILVLDVTGYNPTSGKDLLCLKPRAAFQPHLCRISQVQVVQSQSDQWMIVTAAPDCTVCLSTIDGVKVGVLAACQDLWNLEDPTTYPGGTAPTDEPFVPLPRPQRTKRQRQRPQVTKSAPFQAGRSIFHQLSVAHRPDLDIVNKTWDKVLKSCKVVK
eukprot:GEMP01004478.1.p1 GENE.GEMP01004478.1~~GEMP01004478.1.p1  ORF type:complete len:881 (+),score=148.55 GEMP01004478.1:207-2849(+)